MYDDGVCGRCDYRFVLRVCITLYIEYKVTASAQ
jgi:hypothetical protein